MPLSRPSADLALGAPPPACLAPRQTLYGGKGSDSHLSSLPTEADIVSTCEACYEIDSGQSRDTRASSSGNPLGHSSIRLASSFS